MIVLNNDDPDVRRDSMGNPGDPEIFWFPIPQGIVRAQIFWLKIIDRFKATLLLAIQLIRDHFRNGLGAHTYIYDTHDFNGTTAFWLYESFFSSSTVVETCD